MRCIMMLPMSTEMLNESIEQCLFPYKLQKLLTAARHVSNEEECVRIEKYLR